VGALNEDVVDLKEDAQTAEWRVDTDVTNVDLTEEADVAADGDDAVVLGVFFLFPFPIGISAPAGMVKFLSFRGGKWAGRSSAPLL